MYETSFGLAAPPFDVTPNPKYLLLTPTHREALHVLEYGIRSHKGIVLLLGEAGTGKTTLLRKTLSMRLSSNGAPGGDCVYIKNPRLQPPELFEHLVTGFNLPPDAARSKTALLKHLEDALTALRAAGRSAALIVDEGQALADDLVEELRLLANIESDDTKLLPLVLAGQPELAERLNQSRLRQFKQRIALRCELSRFGLQETAMYIFGRVRMAGGDASKLFTRDAVVAVHDASKGIPRTINVICDNALLTAFALQRRPVDAAIVSEVVRDFDLSGHRAEDATAESATPADAEGEAGERGAEPPDAEEREVEERDAEDQDAPVSERWRIAQFLRSGPRVASIFGRSIR